MRRVAPTGMSVNAPLGDDLDTCYEAPLAGRSAITQWRFIDDPGVYAEIGGGLSDYDAPARLAGIGPRLPEAVCALCRKLFRSAPFSARLSLSSALQAWLHAVAVLVGVQHRNERYLLDNHRVFLDEEPDWIDAQAALLDLDSDHAGSIGEALGCGDRPAEASRPYDAGPWEAGQGA